MLGDKSSDKSGDKSAHKATGLATRCSACDTVFRVVPDQLRVSEGWVRCGRCSEVFNALEGLVDLETGLPKRSLGAGLAPAVGDGSEAQESQFGEYDYAHPAARPGAPALASIRASSSQPAAPPAMPPAVRHATIQDDAGAADSSLETRPDFSTQISAEELAQANVRPSFVATADRAALWRRPRVRAALLLVGLLAAIGLPAQVTHEYRNLVAAAWPESRPWLEQACASLNCKVEAAQAIENLAVESSGLVRVEKSNLYRLQVGLRNRAGIDLAVPALDVTLTDSQGRLIARKVLRAADLGAPQATIGAGRELNLQATLQAAAAVATAPGGGEPVQPIAGYTIELFYP